MMDPTTTKIAADVVSKISISTAAWGIAKIKKSYDAYNLLVIGQERAGKTSLYNFLCLKLLALNGENTSPTLGPVNSRYFAFDWDVNGTIHLELRNVGDRSGQIGPAAHAKMLFPRDPRKKPHIVVVVLDITTLLVSERIHDSYIRWLEWFCIYLAGHLLNRPRRARSLNSSLRTFIVLLNKVDLIDPANAENTLKTAEKNIRDILKSRLQQHMGGRVDFFPILPCSMVSDPVNGTRDETLGRLKNLVTVIQKQIIAGQG